MIYSWQELSKQIEAELSEHSFSGNPSELYDPIAYTMQLGGKRIRPTLCLLASQLFEGNLSNSINLAKAVEVFHNFTLVHDDIMDEAPLRRGKPTVYKKWSRDIAILSGDVMLVQAYQFLCKGNAEVLPKLLSLFNRTAIEVCEGQQLDMNFESSTEVKTAEYIEMIRLKTAVLLACSLKLGALEAGASEKDAELIYSFGENIGIAFQIQDDYLDAYANPEEFGKRVGGDIISNKKTFLLLTALEKSTKEQQNKLSKLLSISFDDDEKIKGVLEIYNELTIPDLTKAAMRYYFKKGMESLEAIQKDAALKKPLIDLAEQLMNRKK